MRLATNNFSFQVNSFLGAESESSVSEEVGSLLYLTPPLSFSFTFILCCFFSKQAYRNNTRKGQGKVVKIAVLGGRHAQVVRPRRKLEHSYLAPSLLFLDN